MERQPSVDAARHGDAAGIAFSRHPIEAGRAKALWIGARSGPTRGIEREGEITVAVNQRQEVAAEPAQMLMGDRQNRSGSDRRVDRAASRSERLSPGRSRERIDGAHGRFRGKPRAKRREDHRWIFAGAPLAMGLGA